MTLQKLLDEIKRLKEILSNTPNDEKWLACCEDKLQGIKETVEAVDKYTRVGIATVEKVNELRLWQQIKEELK